MTSIGKAAFSGCSGIATITIPGSVSSIGNSAFANCSNLTTVNIPGSVTIIEGSAFQGCSGLTSVIMLNGVKSIGNYTFSQCSSLTSVTFPGSLKSIGGYAFKNCSSLTSVTIPNYVTKIGEYAFSYCSVLNTISIGSGCESIGSHAFSSCPEIVDMYCYAENVPFVGYAAFNDSYIEYATLHVPSASIDAYKGEEPWSSFKSIVKIDMPEHNLTYLVDGEVYKTYVIEEGTAITPEAEPTKEGYTFSGWSEIPETMPTHDVTVTGSFFKIGDANGDNTVSAADIVEVINYIIGNPTEKFNNTAADTNEDIVVNVADIVQIVNIIMGSE